MDRIQNVTQAINRLYDMLRRGSEKAPLSFEQLTVAGTAVALPSIPALATYAVVTLESTVTSGIVVRTIEGETPTASVGMPKSHLDSWDIIGYDNLVATRLIQAQVATNVLNITYYK